MAANIHIGKGKLFKDGVELGTFTDLTISAEEKKYLDEGVGMALSMGKDSQIILQAALAEAIKEPLFGVDLAVGKDFSTVSGVPAASSSLGPFIDNKIVAEQPLAESSPGISMFGVPMVKVDAYVPIEAVVLHSAVTIMGPGGMTTLPSGTTLYRHGSANVDLSVEVHKVTQWLHKQNTHLREKVVSLVAGVADRDAKTELHLAHIEELMGRGHAAKEAMEGLKSRWSKTFTEAAGIIHGSATAGTRIMAMQNFIGKMHCDLIDTLGKLDSLTPSNHITLTKEEVMDLARMVEAGDDVYRVSIIDCPEAGLYDEETGNTKKSRLVGYYTDDLEAGVMPLGEVEEISVGTI